MHQANRHPVQLYEAFIQLFLGVIFWNLIKRYKNLPNLWPYYLIVYCLQRILVEIFRGDTIRGLWFGFISSSQIISLLLMIMTVIYLFKQRLHIRFN